MKRYLLIAGSCYYPDYGTNDWVGCFETKEAAEVLVEKGIENILYTKGPRKNQIKEIREYLKVNGRICDWYEIVDLNDWIL